MRISLINPNLSGDVSILDMGLTYLATYINEKTPHKADIIDFTFHGKGWQKHLKRKIEEHGPEVIGITCTSLYLHYIKAMAKEIKETFGLNIICGGYHASLEPEDTIGIPEVDAICIGDGEYSLTEYLDALRGKGSFDGIKGVWIKQNGNLVKNPLRELTSDIDGLPVPDYDLWEDIDDYLYFNQLLYFIGTRGCPYACSYCSEEPMRQAVPGRHYRERNPRAFVHEIKQQWGKYKNRNMNLAHTFDPVFTLKKEWLKEFCDEYKKTGLSGKLPFSCFSRADLLEEEKLEILREAGCRIVRIGIETGNYKIRKDIYEKNITDEQIIKTIELCKKYGMGITGYYILGGPAEDRSTLQDTFNLAKRIDVNRPVFFIYQPLPKTKSRQRLLDMGGLIETEKMLNIDSLHHASAIRTKELSPMQIQLFQYKCLFYFVSKRIIRLLKKQGLGIFINFTKYFVRARKRRVPLWYTLAYFLICCDDNLIS